MDMKKSERPCLTLVFATAIMGVILFATFNTIIGVYVLVVFVGLLLISCLMVYGFSCKLWSGF